MIEHLILDYDTTPEMLTYNTLIHYKGKKKFRNVKSIEAKVNTQELTLSFLGPMFPNIEKLRLNNSIISSIRDIGCSFPKLRFLSLAQCNITSLDGIATISSNLQELYLAGNKIPDLVDLLGMNQLKIIDLEDNGISNFSTIEILKFCDKLSSLTLKKNPIAIDPNYQKKIFQILPKLSYLDETRPSKTIPVKPPPPINTNTSTNSNKESTQKVQSPQQSKQKVEAPTQNKQNVQQKVQSPRQEKQAQNPPPKVEPNKQSQSQNKQLIQQKSQKAEAQQQNKQVGQSNQQKVETNKPKSEPPKQKIDQTKQTSQSTTSKGGQNTPKSTNQTDKNNNTQARRRPPSADNVKRAVQSQQSNSQTNIQKKVELPSTPPPQQQSQSHAHAPRKIPVPPTTSNTKENSTQGVKKLTDRNPRPGTATSRFSRPNTKLVVSKGESNPPKTGEKVLHKNESENSKFQDNSASHMVNPSDIFSSSSNSPHAKQMSNRFNSQKESANSESKQQFSDMKKPFNRSAVISSAKKTKGQSKSRKNEEVIMTDLVQDMVDKNNDDSNQNKTCLYERSAFPELNSLVMKKTSNKNAKPPEIIKPLSARGPVYV